MKAPFAIGLVWVICLAGCAGNSGQMRTSLELTRAFEEGRPPPEYRHYATGRENLPNAVIGIDRRYRQQARFWREIDPESGDLARAIQNLFPSLSQDPRASYLLSPDGEIVGVYGSTIYWTSIRMGEGNEVYVFPPGEPEERRGSWSLF